MARKCYAPSRTGRFCWKNMNSPKKCKPKSFRAFHPGGRPDVVFTSCRKKSNNKSMIVREGKLKLRGGKCPRPNCRRGKFA